MSIGRSSSATARPRILVIGLDGATFDIIKPMVAEGRLPNLGRLMSAGTDGVLRSTYPPITPTAWTSFATGKNPGNHGLFDFQRIEPDSYTFVPVPANQHGQRSLWGILSDAGRRSVVLDVPFTYPPEPIQGCVITGYGTPTAEGTVFTFPPELRDQLVARCGSCEISTVSGRFDLSDDYFQRWDDILASRACIAPYLMDREDWDLFMIVYGVTDNMQHNLWAFLEPQHPAYHSNKGDHFRQQLFSYYARTDELIGQLLERCQGLAPNLHVLVMSDHGFGSTRTSKYLSKLLIDEGLVRYQGLPALSRPTTWLMQRLLNFYHSTPFLSNLVRSLSGTQKESLKQTLSRSTLFPTAENIDWEHTLAFPGGYGLQVYVNRQDRFPRGTVAPGQEYESLVEHITERLLALADPTSGDPVVKAVHRAQDIYRGAFADQAPDLIVEYENVYTPRTVTRPHQAPTPSTVVSGSRQRSLNPGLEGNHTMDGIFIGYGPHILAGAPVEPQIIDLAPTALYLLGLPVPGDMDGRVLTEIIEPGYVAEHPVLYGDAATTSASDNSYSPEEAELVREQLRALGYLD
jgi:predicted AlkP superfamily phosphohydrolase/phosphomutase